MKTFLHSSLQARLGLALMLFTLAPTSLVGWLAYDHEIELTKADRIKIVGRVADTRHEQLKMVLQRATGRAQRLLLDFGQQCGGLAGHPECLRKRLEDFLQTEGALGAVIEHQNAEPVTVGQSAVAAGAVPIFKSGQLAQFAKYGAAVRRDYFIVAGDAQGKVRLAVTYPLDVIQSIFVGDPDLGKSGETFLSDREGFFITAARYPSSQGHSHPISAVPMRRCLTPEDAETLDLDYRSVKIIHGFRFVAEIGGGCIMAHIDQAEAFASAQELQRKVIAALLAFALLAVVTAMYVSRRLSLPIRQLTEVAGKIAAGDHSARASATAYREAGELAAAGWNANGIMYRREGIYTSGPSPTSGRTWSTRKWTRNRDSPSQQHLVGSGRRRRAWIFWGSVSSAILVKYSRLPL